MSMSRPAREVVAAEVGREVEAPEGEAAVEDRAAADLGEVDQVAVKERHAA
jgi:hypothetical protein